MRLRDGTTVESVQYRFTVWHQLSQGFHGPYRAEGRLLALSAEQLELLVARDVVLDLDDGRFMPARVLPLGKFVAHTAPEESDPWADPWV